MSNQSETTIHDIARKLNLSASTVSRALKDNPVISEPTRILIKRIADEMGYRPNILAANLRTKRTNTIGVIVPLINRHFFSSVISGVEEVAYNQGFAVTISQSNDKIEKEIKIALALFANRVDGLIASIGMETNTFDHLKLFSERKIPIVFFDRVVEEIAAHKIVVDDYGGGFRATQQLIEQGAKNVAHIGGPLNLKIYENRQKGYCDALKNAGLKVNQSLIINNSLSREEGSKAIRNLMQQEIKPDAVFCANDITALSVIIYLHEIGIRVPEDMVIVGFSNEPFSEVVTPSISTVKQPGFLMGQKAAQLIIQQILHDNDNPSFKTIVLPTELIIRDSSKRKQ